MSRPDSRLVFLKPTTFSVNQRLFCRASFAAFFLHKDKFSTMRFTEEKYIIQIESGLLGHPLLNIMSISFLIIDRSIIYD